MPDVEKLLDKLPKSNRVNRIAGAVLVLIVFVLIGILFWQVHQNSQVAANNAAVARARGQALGTANAKLTQNGIPAVKPTDAKATPGQTDVGPTTPSSTPKAEQGVQGEKGDQGPGPSTAQVAAAVTDYCAAHDGCANGPTKAQVAAAVLTYCKGDKCQGEQGERGLPGKAITGPPGATGEPGKDATGKQGPQGEPGQNATDDQVAAAVSAYCSSNNCVGPQGPAGPAGKDATGAPGKDGKDGAPGRGIDSTVCGADAHWHLVYTDGTTADAGVCRETTTVTATAPPSSPNPSSTVAGQ